MITEPSRLTIVLYPAPVLSRDCAPVTEFGPQLRALVNRMYELMHLAKGVGLAAPQVGVPLRLFVFNITGEPKDDSVCINPEFAELEGAVAAEEGCLSLPGITVTMRRAVSAVMRAQDLEGNWLELRGRDLPARVWQHETDHLNGRLIVDNMSPSDEIANRKALKQLKADYKGARSRR
ncbi:MAG: peptide deformylase [Planctomycetota bacterium]